MNEFVTVSSSSYDPASLASQLSEKSADGWTVVAIVPTGGDVTAFLSRESSSSSSGGAGADMMASSGSDAHDSGSEPMGTMSPAPSEPAGWAVAPAAEPAAAYSPGAAYTPAASNAPATVIQSSMSPIGGDQSYNPANSYQPHAAAAAAASTPAVPAGWFADPAGRYELRYWDGSAWTEHVSRSGQQFTDAPVA